MTLEELGNSKITVQQLEVSAGSNPWEVEQVSPPRGRGPWEDGPLGRWALTSFQVQINLGKFDSSNKIYLIGVKWEKSQINLKG